MKERQAYHENNIRNAAADPQSFYAGVLPVLCVVEGLPINLCNMFPVRSQPRADLVMDGTVTTILRELIRYCVYTMGTPLRAALEHPDVRGSGAVRASEGEEVDVGATV